MVPVMTTVARYQPPIAPLPDAIVFTSIHRVRHFLRHDLFSSVSVFAPSRPSRGRSRIGWPRMQVEFYIHLPDL